jgi:hypothetical protein
MLIPYDEVLDDDMAKKDPFPGKNHSGENSLIVFAAYSAVNRNLWCIFASLVFPFYHSKYHK